MTDTKTKRAQRGYIKFNEVVRAAVLAGVIIGAACIALAEIVWAVIKAMIQVAS